jgi:hypothetical protein
MATDLGGNGYPKRYTLTASVFAAALKDGIPKHKGPDVFGDDYLLLGVWTGNATIDLELIKALSPDELLEIEAWDQS